jgi:hypothetical protein
VLYLLYDCTRVVGYMGLFLRSGSKPEYNKW